MGLLSWHFCPLIDGIPTLRHANQPAPPVGEWLVHDGNVEICARGLHASWRAIDALEYVDYENVAACLVEVEDVVTEHTDKFVCRRRRIVAWVPCDELLRLFSREAALSVAQYWTMPPIVREYLETGNEEIRFAAWSAAWSAAEIAAESDLAARSAAWSAARSAAESAARSAAWSAARSAAESAARSATWSAARSATWSAAEIAAESDLNALLESILLGELEPHS